MSPVRRVRVALAAIAVAVVLSGCSADWSGSRRLSSPECLTASQLFAPSASGASDAALADALRAHAPAELTEILSVFAQRPRIDETASAQEVAAGSEERARHERAHEVLQEWAVLACGAEIAREPEIAGEDEELPGLGTMQIQRSDLNGTPQIAVSGALEPVHAVVLCEAARTQAGNLAAISVVDADGLRLALAEPGADCTYDPLLLEALEQEDGAG